ncbi:uncharacterized protein LOC108112207 [Drosophila eugracilis]|uniref:uncharacterized protein LOC108112207 n=1 Tax=Drosophila eugracilis TaxID=29029 RepID=UPI0007E6BDB7|nr:uncharacterized protein LOC108112207 [Drosophila eugracilis]
MRLVYLVALCSHFLLKTHGYETDIAYRICEDNTYTGCHDFCRRGCNGTEYSCLHRCHKGCGCIQASIIRNNGGCRRLVVCEANERDSASLENQDYAGDYVTDWWHDEEAIREVAETIVEHHKVDEPHEDALHDKPAHDEPARDEPAHDNDQGHAAEGAIVDDHGGELKEAIEKGKKIVASG